MAITLNSNEIFSALSNMIISQQVFADNIQTNQTLVNKAKTDGGLYGDTKLFYATDALKSAAWGNDAEATNLLQLHRPPAPECQAIELDIFRQICLTIDNYLSKRAWSTEGAFSSFNSVMQGWMRDTKRIYDGTLYNVFIGTTESTTGRQAASKNTITLSGTKDGETIAEYLANLLVDMGDYSRDFNDYSYLRSYAKENIKVIWNAKYMNKIKKLDLPTVFHKDGLVDKLDEDYMPARYFGTEITTSNYSTYSASTPAAGKPIDSDTGTYVPGTNNANGILRSMIEQDVTVGGTTTHLFAGDELPANAVVYASSAVKIPCYIQKDKIIAKVLVKLPPYMSAFEVATSFFNPKSLTETDFLTFGHNTLAYLKNYPFITLVQA